MFLILLCFGLVAWIDCVPLVRRKEWKDTAAFGLLFALALTVSILNQLGTPIPSTILFMDDLMHKMGITY